MRGPRLFSWRLAVGMPAALILVAAAQTRAGELDVVTPRALGMGGALRGSATGDAATVLNPSGMSLLRSYAIEASYELMRPDSVHVGHVSVVDSTSAANLGGGLYYTYAQASPKGAAEPSRHEGGLALSFP